MTLINNAQLNAEDAALVQAALKATQGSYAPYSHFHVGAALRMEDGTCYTGANQENMAFPACVCAERVTLLYATANSSSTPVCLAVTACDNQGWVSEPVTPCGECRQVLLEMQKRYNHPIRVLMAGKEQTLLVEDASELLPGAFSSAQLSQP